MNELVLGFGILDLIFKVIAGITFAKVVVRISHEKEHNLLSYFVRNYS